MAVEENLTEAPKRPEVVDPRNVPIVFVDWIITGGVYNDMVNVSLGTVDHSLKNADADLARVVVAAQLRFSRTFAHYLHQALGRVLGLPPQEGGSPSPPPMSPPKNTIN